MKGSIRFNNDINVEVDVDPAAEEGARLSSAVNLVDGQELGVGGGSDLPVVSPVDEGKVLTVDDQGKWVAKLPEGAVIIVDDGTSLDKTFAEIYDLIKSGTPCYISYIEEGSDNDLDTDFLYFIDLMPVMQVYKYNELYRINATASHVDSLTLSPNVGTPGVCVYEAANSSAYPAFLKYISVIQASLRATGRE